MQRYPQLTRGLLCSPAMSSARDDIDIPVSQSSMAIITLFRVSLSDGNDIQKAKGHVVCGKLGHLPLVFPNKSKNMQNMVSTQEFLPLAKTNSSLPAVLV